MMRTEIAKLLGIFCLHHKVRGRFNGRRLATQDAALKAAALRQHERRLLPGVFGLLVKRIGRELDQLHADVIGIVNI